MNHFELITVIDWPVNQENVKTLENAMKIEDDMSRLIEDHMLNIAIAEIESENMRYSSQIAEIQRDSKKLASNF